MKMWSYRVDKNFWFIIVLPDMENVIIRWVFQALEPKLSTLFECIHRRNRTAVCVWMCVWILLTSQYELPRCSQRSSPVPGHHRTGPRSEMQPAWREEQQHIHVTCDSLQDQQLLSHTAWDDYCSWRSLNFVHFLKDCSCKTQSPTSCVSQCCLRQMLTHQALSQCQFPPSS